jgi:hypothetical protein
MTKYPFARNNIRSRWSRHKIPCPIVLQGCKFIDHCSMPLRILQSTTVAFRKRTKNINMQIKAINRPRHTTFATSVHIVSILGKGRANRSQYHGRRGRWRWVRRRRGWLGVRLRHGWLGWRVWEDGWQLIKEGEINGSRWCGYFGERK